MNNSLMVHISPDMEEHAKSIDQSELRELLEQFGGDYKLSVNQYLANHGKAFVFTLYIKAENVPIGIFEDVQLSEIEREGGIDFNDQYYFLDQLYLDMRIIAVE